ncbi:MAG: sodium:proton antiporter [Gammaproteobacteria bacterium]|nr:sodium:proton antiporter [Gammaproteobacteria bacterium]
MRVVAHRLIVAGCTVVGLALVYAVVNVQGPAPDLALAVSGALAESGVSHPVTAVLLNFRAYDTLLEVAVMLVAPLVAAALPTTAPAPAKPTNDPVLQALAAVAVPLALLLAIYLLLIGASRSGGAFHAAAVLAGALVLLQLATGRSLPAWLTPTRQQPLLILGLALFCAVGWLSLLLGGYFLGYPPAWAGVMILVIESGLTLSLALALWRLMP